MITFLNTDLDVISDHEPTLLVVALSRTGRVHPPTQPPLAREDGTWFVNFETYVESHTPEATAADILDAIEALDGDERAFWDACRSRVLDLGFEVGAGRSQSFDLSPSIVARAAAVGLAIRVTRYPEVRESASRSATDSRSSS